MPSSTQTAPPKHSEELHPEELNPFVIAQQQFSTAVRYLPELDSGLVEFLIRPERVITVEFPIEKDDGTVAELRWPPRAPQPRARPGKGRCPLPSQRQRR